ncbi:MAG: molybdenum cofactor guanylyltransferase MobA [Campylobacterota bacterium]|nr:molybdenum cofactor guanylyltransferase MobA [Campylobacterota bacterium]
MIDMHCVIFAGGKSSRMGEDKALLPFGEYSSLAEFQYERMKKIFLHVSISTKDSDKFSFTCKTIQDPKDIKTFAPTAGFVAMFDALHVKRVFVLSVDSPFVDEITIKRLIEADNDTLDAVIAKTPQGTHPMCGIYHSSLHVSFQEMLKNDNHRLGKLLSISKTKYVYFEDEAPFANLNHPHEYAVAFSRCSRIL